VGVPSLISLANRGLEDGIGAVERVNGCTGADDVENTSFAYGMQSSSTKRATTSSVFLARSLTRSRTFESVNINQAQL